MRWLALTLLLLAAPAANAAEEERSELAALLDADNDAFPRATEPRAFVFPDDHGPHPEYRNEWWYVTGNLEAASGRRFGFELTIFRFALAPNVEASPSAWRSNQVYIAHLAVTDPGAERFVVAEKYSRGALGLAGARARPFAVWIDDWSIRARDPAGDPERWQLVARSAEIGLDLELDAQKSPVLNGDEGLSQKSPEPGNASYYYSITRLATAGELRLGGETFRVTGTSWLDREWSSSALGQEQTGWDWFALQLGDGSELMFYNLRLRDGTSDANSAGTYVRPDGEAIHLGRDDVTLTVLDTWDSPEGGTYPARWRIAVPAAGIDVEVTPVMPDQELFTTVRYWEGAVDVRGSVSGRAADGVGYVELTGYADSPE